MRLGHKKLGVSAFQAQPFSGNPFNNDLVLGDQNAIATVSQPF